MPITRPTAVTGTPITISTLFEVQGGPNSGQLYDPANISAVNILQIDGQTLIQSLAGSAVVRNSLGNYSITIDAIQTPMTILDQWVFQDEPGGSVETYINSVNVQSTPVVTATASIDPQPRDSAALLRPLLLTVEFLDTRTGQPFDPFQVRQVQIVEQDGVTVIQTIAQISRIGIGKYRVTTNPITGSPRTVLDRWQYTANQGEPERSYTQSTVVNAQSAAQAAAVSPIVAPMLCTGIGPNDSVVVLRDTMKNISVTFTDETGTAVNPQYLSLRVTSLRGGFCFEDKYLPTNQMSPNPPRITNPSPGMFNFPFGLDNGSRNWQAHNRTDCRMNYLFTWLAYEVMSQNAAATLMSGNSALTWTAQSVGSPGNFISVNYVDPGLASQGLKFVRNGATITVSLATNSASAITTTANDIVNYVTSDLSTSAIVKVSLASGSDGTGVLATTAATNLIGGSDGSPEIVASEVVSVISLQEKALLPGLRLMIDKSVKLVDPSNQCFLGYTEGMLIKYLEYGTQVINSYQPTVYFTIDDFPYDVLGYLLIQAAMFTGLTSQELFAVDTDVISYSDPGGGSFILSHQAQLASVLQRLSAQLDRLVPAAKLGFVGPGFIHYAMGADFRLQSLIDSAPNGALFRNAYSRA